VLAQTPAEKMQEFLRDEVLRLTSDLRLNLERLHCEPRDPGALARARRAGKALAETGAQARLRSLMRCGKVYEDALAANLASVDPDAARRAFAGLHGTVGLVEQLLDWSIEGADETRQERLYRKLGEIASRAAVRPDGPRGLAPADPTEGAAGALPVAEPVASGFPATETAPTGAALTDFEREMLQVFASEAAERLARCEELLLQLEPDPGNAELLQQVLREFHTMKGSASAAGLKAVAEQLHTGESVVAAVARGAKVLDGGKLVDVLLKLVDAIKSKVREGPTMAPPPSDMSTEIARLLEPIARATGTRAAEGTTATPEVDTGVVKVESGRLTALMQEVGELVASGTDLDQQIRSLEELRSKLGPGDLSDQLAAFIRSLEKRAAQLTRITSGLQEQVSHLQFLPLEIVFRRLLRPIRDAARQEGKLVEIRFSGGERRLDRPVVEALYAPLLHLVRNAVAHGIEPPEARQAGGKPEAGTLRVTASNTGEEGWIDIMVEDDGAGLDLERILAKARGRGLVAPGTTPPSEEIARLVFHPGLSTRETVTEISGRGVGMDVVEKRVQALGGSVDLDTRPGAGTTVRLHVPMSSPVVEVVVLAVGDRLYAVPADIVAETIPVAMADLDRTDTTVHSDVDGHRLRVHPLGPPLGEPEPSEEGEVVVLRCPEAAAAFLVDAARDRCEVAMRPVSRNGNVRTLVTARGTSGGNEVFLLDVGGLLHLAGERAGAEGAP
jgi:two-component system chemotaxis sensor kinase CheA